MFRLTTDTSCDEYKHLLDEAHISYIPLIYTIENKEHEDDLSSDEAFEKFYDKIEDGSMPTTSQINAYRHYKFFKRILKKDPHTPILHLCLSSGLSGTYQRALEGADMVKEKFPEAQIYILDTLSATQGHNLVLKKAKELRDNNTPVNEAFEYLEKYRLRCHHWIFIDDLLHLKRGGRVSAVAAIFGTALKIKPLAIVNEEGKIKIVDKIRGTKRGLQVLIEKMETYILDKENIKMVIANAGNTKLCLELKEMILAKYPNAHIELGWIGPVIGSHTGKGTIGIGFEGILREKI